MELTWTTDLPERPHDVSDRSVVGRSWFWGPFTLGRYRYFDREGGGFWFINVRGTRLGICREW